MCNIDKQMKSEKGNIIMTIIVVLIILVVVGAFGYAIYEDINYGVKEGTVIDKRYSSAYTTWNPIYNGKTTTSYPIYHPPEWNIKIQKEEKDIWIEVTEQEYNNLKVGDYYGR